MKTFEFESKTRIEAETESEAKNIFADTSFNFAADASCEEVIEDEYTCKKCGSSNVMRPMYINPNTMEKYHDQSGMEMCPDWCNNCKNEATLIEKEIQS